MDHCHTCNRESVLEVADTLEVKPGLYATINKKAGCATHPPVGLKISAAGEITLVPPTGYTIQNCVLVKG